MNNVWDEKHTHYESLRSKKKIWFVCTRDSWVFEVKDLTITREKERLYTCYFSLFIPLDNALLRLGSYSSDTKGQASSINVEQTKKGKKGSHCLITGHVRRRRGIFSPSYLREYRRLFISAASRPLHSKRDVARCKRKRKGDPHSVTVVVCCTCTKLALSLWFSKRPLCFARARGPLLSR